MPAVSPEGTRETVQSDRPGCMAWGCHSELLKKVSVKHDPVDEDGCSFCHEGPHAEHPTGSGDEFAFTGGSAKSLCFGCHKDLAARVLAAKHPHTPVERGRCTACHRPHGGPYPKLLVNYLWPNLDWGDSPIKHGAMALCWDCHDINLALEERTDTLTRFRDGSRNLHFVHVSLKKARTCKACHDTHAADQEMLIRDNVPFGTGGWKLPIDYTKTATGGNCVVGCHREQSYDRGPAAAQESAAEANASAQVDATAIQVATESQGDEMRELLLALKHGTDQERREAASRLGEIGDSLAVRPLAAIIKRGEYSDVLAAATLALVRIGGDGAGSLLVSKLAALDPYDQQRIARMIGSSGDKEAVGNFIAAVRTAPPELRARFVEGFHLTEDALLTAYLRECLRDENREVRIAAALGLKDHESQERTNALFEALQSRDVDVRLEAIRNLAGSGDERLPDTLIAALADPRKEIRLEVLRTIHRLEIGSYGGLTDTLASLLEDPSKEVRLEAVRVLVQTGGERSAHALWKAMGSGNAVPRDAVYDALLTVSKARMRDLTAPPDWPPKGCAADECHGSYDKETVLHEPVRSGGCLLCHEGRLASHPQGPGRELSPERMKDTGAFCFTCHYDLASIVNAQRHIHEPVRQGRCLACHNVHGSPYRNILRAYFDEKYYLAFKPESYELCWRCHDRRIAMEETTAELTKFRNGTRNLHLVHVNQQKGRSCKACHEPHSSDQEMLIRAVRHETGGWALPVRLTVTPTGGSCVVGCHREMNYDREKPARY